MPITPPSPRQLDYIRTLVTERVQAITALADDERKRLLSQPETTRDASNLIDRLRRLPADPKQVDAGAQAKIDGLVAVLDQLDARDRSFASDLVRSFRQRGDLSERQWPWVERLTAKATAPKVEPAEPGLYMVDGNIVKVYLTQNRRLATKVLHANGSHGSFSYSPGWLAKVRPEHRLTEEQARAFGKQHGFCCACALDLDDDRSLAVGYGPVCAKRYGWFYPSAKQASEMLNRPVDLATVSA
jgi:hypothetical protein